MFAMFATLQSWKKSPNPLWIRELKQASRVGRTQWILLVLILGLTALLAAIGGLAAESGSPGKVGQMLYQVFFSLATAVVTLGGPGIAANTIASEREGKTWEAIQLTGLSPRSVARGKFLAAFSGIALYIVALAPIGAMPFLFGGVGALEVILGFVFLFVYAALATTFGLAVSSFMKSTRGALIVTLILAMFLGPNLYWAFGFGGSVAIRAALSGVTEGLPIWLPLALIRADFGAPYVLFLIAAPLLAMGLPAWFFYEVTLANLSDDAEDRSTRLKIWYAVSSFLVGGFVFAVCGWQATRGSTTSVTTVLLYMCLALLIYHVGFGAFLLAGDPLFPSRRLRIHWQRRQAGGFQRFWGPSLPRTTFLHAVLGVGLLTGFMTLGVVVLGTVSATTSEITTFLCIVFYAIAFLVFVLGLVLWLGSSVRSSIAVRLVVLGIVSLISIAPWVIVSIVGVLGQGGSKIYLALGSPSPFYVFVLLGSQSDSDELVFRIISLGISAVYALLGILFLGLGAVRAKRSLSETLATEADLERALEAEAMPSRTQETSPASPNSPAQSPS
jgi:ABC-type transport system involved in multi-copper enzyme maturation permease subunit